MKFSIKTTSLVLLLSAGLFQPLLAQSYQGSCNVLFKGSSTLHDFQGTVNKVPVVATVKNGLVSMKTEVNILRMSTKDAKRDKNMYKMFHSSRFPKMQVIVSKASVARATPKNGALGTLPVTLIIAGRKTQTTAKVFKLATRGNTSTFNLAMRLSLKKLGLHPKKALFGAVSVKDIVDVQVAVGLRKK